MNKEWNEKLKDCVNCIASMTDEYSYTFIEKLGGEDETYIKNYIDTNYKGLTFIRQPYCTIPIDELKGVYQTYIRWGDKAMLILYENINDQTKSHFINNPKIETIWW